MVWHNSFPFHLFDYEWNYIPSTYSMASSTYALSPFFFGSISSLLLNCQFFFLFLGPHPWYMEVIRGPIRAAATGLHHSHSKARSLTHWVRPGINPASSRILVGFLTHWAATRTLNVSNIFIKNVFYSIIITMCLFNWTCWWHNLH